MTSSVSQTFSRCGPLKPDLIQADQKLRTIFLGHNATLSQIPVKPVNAFGPPKIGGLYNWSTDRFLGNTVEEEWYIETGIIYGCHCP
jgi:hypothetical protein